MAGDVLGTARVAVAQAAPEFLDREASAARVIELIGRAAAEGARIIAFPEGIIPAHPVWYHFQPVTGRESLAMAAELFANAVEIPGPTTERIAAAVREAGITAVVGVCEKRPATLGTMFNSQVFIGPDGAILGVHRKLMPTVGERIVHAGGHGDGLEVFPTEAGPISGLICGENSNPLATHALADLGPRIHVASWPNHFSRNEHAMSDLVLLASRSLAYRSGCFVLNACGTVDERMIARIAVTDEDRAFLRDPANGGGSSIIDPAGHVIAGPMPGDQNGILATDIDLDACVQAKIVHDYTGHYNRADVFTLSVDRNVPQLVEHRTPADRDATPRTDERSTPAGDTPSDGMTGEVAASQP